MLAPERPARGMVVEFETAPLRELLDVVDQKGPVEAYAHVEALAPKVDETRLWKVVAAAALNALELQVSPPPLLGPPKSRTPFKDKKHMPTAPLLAQ